jgi:hypothetical protein
MISRSFLTLLFSLCLYLTFCWTPSFAQTLESSLSEDTLMYLRVPKGKVAWQKFLDSALGQFCQELEIQNLQQKIMKALAEPLQQFEQQLQMATGKSYQELDALLDGSVEFALFDLADPVPPFAFSVGFVNRESGQAFFHERIETLGLPLENQSVGDFHYHILAVDEPPVYLAWVENTLVLSPYLEILQKVATLKTPEKPLTSQKEYQEVSQIVTSPASFRFWVNLKALQQHPKVQNEIPAEAQEVLSYLGFDQWTSLDLAACFEGLDLKFSFQIGTDGTEPRGLSQFLNTTPLNPQLFSRLPQHLTSVSAFQMDPSSFYRAIKNLLQKIAQGDIWKTCAPYIQMFEKELGISLEEALPHGKGTYSFLDFNDGINSQTVWCFHPQEAMESFHQHTLNLLKRTMQVTERPYKGKTIYSPQVRLGHLSRQLANIRPINVAFTLRELFAFPSSYYLDGDRIVAAHLPQTLMDFIDQLESPGKLPSEVEALLNSQVSSLSWSAVNPQGAYYYQAIFELTSAFLPMVQAFLGADITVFDLPPAELFIKHSRPSLSYSKSGKTLLWVNHLNLIPSSFPSLGPASIVGATAVVAAISIPGLLRARISSNEASAIGVLRTISTAQNQFQNASVKDRDLDGVGEYGFFGELAGSYDVPRGMASAPVRPPFISSVFGKTVLENQGIANKSGYNFMMYLPIHKGVQGENGKPVPTLSSLPASSEEDIQTVNLQEYMWVCYAWPESAGKSGNRCFMVNQAGEVMAASNRDENGNFIYYGMESIPAFDAALVKDSEGSHPLEASTSYSGDSADGQYWNSTW